MAKMTLKELKKFVKECKCYTHSGKYHSDDVLSWTFILTITTGFFSHGDAMTIHRVATASDIPANGFAFDIGFGKFDHHQLNAKTYPLADNGESLKMASFGLLVDEFLEQYLISTGVEDSVAKLAANAMLENFCKPMDLSDNYGLVRYPNTLSATINAMRDTSKHMEDDEVFALTAELMYPFMLSWINWSVDFAKLKVEADKLANTAKENHMSYVDCTEEYIPASHFKGTCVKFIIGKDLRTAGNFTVTSVNSDQFPIQAVEGESGCTFIHSTKFTASFSSKESAISACLRS